MLPNVKFLWGKYFFKKNSCRKKKVTKKNNYSITSENVSSEYGITRQEQDAFSAHSHQKAAAAQKAGYFKEEIVPCEVTILDKDGENPKTIIVDQDEGIRANSTTESLGKLKPAFSPTGCTTAGNASQISDGAAAVLLMKRKTALKLNLSILGKYVTSAVVGVSFLFLKKK